MKQIPAEYYGDSWRWFVATVVDANPPRGMEGRVRVRVHGLHSNSIIDIPQRDLPWAQCLLPVTEAGSSGLGTHPGIVANSLVFGFYADGENSQVPIVAGSLPRAEFRTPANEDGFRFFPGTAEGSDPESVLRYREDRAVRYFVSGGIPLGGAAMLVSALSSFSGMDVERRTIGPWSGKRGERLAMMLGERRGDFGAQLEFASVELRTTQTAALTGLTSPTATAVDLLSSALEYFRGGEPPPPADVLATNSRLLERFYS